MPLKAVKNSDRSASRSKPTIFAGGSRGPPMRHGRQPGRRCRCRPNEDPQRAPLDELRQAARCVEEVERVRLGGVSRTIRSKCSSAWATASPSPCTPATLRARRRSAVDPVLEHPSRFSSSVRAADQLVEGALASSRIAVSSPSISTPAAANKAGSTRFASSPIAASPSESASRLAGSMVSRTPSCRPRPRGRAPPRRRLADAAAAGADADRLAFENPRRSPRLIRSSCASLPRSRLPRPRARR